MTIWLQFSNLTIPHDPSRADPIIIQVRQTYEEAGRTIAIPGFNISWNAEGFLVLQTECRFTIEYKPPSPFVSSAGKNISLFCNKTFFFEQGHSAEYTCEDSNLLAASFLLYWWNSSDAPVNNEKWKKAWIHSAMPPSIMCMLLCRCTDKLGIFIFYFGAGLHVNFYYIH